MRPTRRRRRRKPPVLDILVQSRRWAGQRNARAIIRRAIGAAAVAVPAKGEIAIVLTNDAAMRVLNRTWRRKDEPTNVLSFPAGEDAHPLHLGDIVIAYETTAREARAERKPFRHHLAHLAVHGYLHLAGYDHVSDSEAKIMENLEISVLKRLKVPNPYVARDAKA